MKSFSLGLLIPVILALAGLSAILFWTSVGPEVDLDLRVPGLDRPASSGSDVGPEKPLEGTLETFAGRASKLPGDWPCFRGVLGDGIGRPGVPLAKQWPADGPKKLWSIPLGEGHAGATVFKGSVFVLDYDREHQRDALRCFSLDDGKEIWRFSYPASIKRNHGMSRTVPAVTDKYIVSIGPKLQVACLDPATGKKFWLLDMVGQFGATVPQWYAGQCPLLENERVILAPGGKDALLAALDCRTGEVVWKSPNPHRWVMTHVSVVPMEFAGKKMYVYCGKGGVAGVSAEDGSILWETTDWKISIATVPTPVVLPGGRLFFSGGYNSGAAIIQLKEKEGRIVAETVKKIPPGTFGSTQQTPILYEDHLYGVREKDKQLVCLDLDGKEVWKSGSQKKFGIGPYLIADGLLYVLNDDGMLTMTEATASGYKQLAQSQVLQGHDAWGPMAMIGRRLILRDLTEMICIDVGEGGIRD